MEKRHYGAIDGLRMIAAFGIVLMHIRANNDYEITGYVCNTIIPSLTNCVFLFMTVSAFGMCCGYYENILNNRINLSELYGKRFKILGSSKKFVFRLCDNNMPYNCLTNNYSKKQTDKV